MTDIDPIITSSEHTGLLHHADRHKWNEKHRAAAPSYEPHPLVGQSITAGLDSGPVLELACGISGSALYLAGLGFDVTVVDVSDIALLRLMAEARRRGIEQRITPVFEDLTTFTPPVDAFSLVLCTCYWNSDLFARACAAVAVGDGLLAWEAVSDAEHGFRRSWCVGPGEPAALLPNGYVVVQEEDVPSGKHDSRRVLARREVG
ncbi:class I SAM-dependent methyltransferase [Lentzea sp. NPDC051208]|uniref:class I SAM-dependent methyltransferase n=1 Tax=Lentzea sp. NPDC051208 TaxID=3154642 RepID=UPI00343587D2